MQHIDHGCLLKRETTMKPHELTFPLVLFVLACNRPGENVAVENEEEGVPSDLPCGGADLMTDDRNCGTCGNACNVMWPDTEYAAGGCIEGECGRTWSAPGPLSAPPEVETCEELCSYGDIPCVARGCSGMTAYVCADIGDFGNECYLGDPAHHALVEFTGECDEPIPYPDWFEADTFTFISYACCCGP
jgi:hypothetical protein